MDSIDEKLVQMLGADARQTSETLAKKLRVSASTVRRRIKNLVDRDIIRTIALVDQEKAGFPLVAVIAFDVANDKVNACVDTLAVRPEVKWVATTTGRFDILVLARFRSTEDLSFFIQNEVTKIQGLKDSETFVCLHIGKGRYLPL